jgi:predicted metal-dependent HD superfamily phosphohydrolase
MQLRERFSTLCSEFTNDTHLIERLWMEIEKKYSEKGRHYHNFDHLENMFRELNAITAKIQDYTAIAFSVFYHDVIYNASSKSNEEKSALFAEKHLQQLGSDPEFAEKISRQIIATKSHQKSGDDDTDYLVDADLSIFGQEPDKYKDYAQKVRKEYSIYPDFLYNPGRKKVLNHFLDSESIFKKEYFKEKYEQQARKNIRSEIKY